jgi:hypothetical protein
LLALKVLQECRAEARRLGLTLRRPRPTLPLNGIDRFGSARFWGQTMQHHFLLRFQASAVEASGRMSRGLMVGLVCVALLAVCIGALGLEGRAKPAGFTPVAITTAV